MSTHASATGASLHERIEAVVANLQTFVPGLELRCEKGVYRLLSAGQLPHQPLGRARNAYEKLCSWFEGASAGYRTGVRQTYERARANATAKEGERV
jgi:hypothetical protein